MLDPWWIVRFAPTLTLTYNRNQAPVVTFMRAPIPALVDI